MSTPHVYDAEDPVEEFEPLPFTDTGIDDVEAEQR